MRVGTRFDPADFESPIRTMRRLKNPRATDLGIGEPLDCWPPETARRLGEHLAEVLPAGGIPYLPHDGHKPLRQHLAERHGIDDVLVTNGAQSALAAATMARVRPGDRVLVPDPGFVAYPELVRWAGGMPVAVGAGPDAHGLDLEALERGLAGGARGLVLGQPANPTGLALDARALARTMDLLAARDAWLLADVVYDRLPVAWDSIPSPRLAGTGPWGDVTVPDGLDVALVSSVSKAWGAPGLRVGWLATRSIDWFTRAKKIHALFNTHASGLAQWAALWLLENLSPARVAATLRARGEAMIERLRPVVPHIGLPPGSFYLWVPLPTGADDVAWATAAATRDDGVAVIPGSPFGQRGRAFVRVSFGPSMECVVEGASRLARLLEGNADDPGLGPAPGPAGGRGPKTPAP